jgi:hypothetical protein
MTVGGPAGITHKVKATMTSRYIEIERLSPLVKREITGEYVNTMSAQSVIINLISVTQFIRFQSTCAT